METIAQRIYTCKKCKHKWVSRVTHEPVSCPRCKRNDWNRPTVSGASIIDVKEKSTIKIKENK